MSDRIENVTPFIGIFTVAQLGQSGIGIPASGSVRYQWSSIASPARSKVRISWGLNNWAIMIKINRMFLLVMGPKKIFTKEIFFFFFWTQKVLFSLFQRAHLSLAVSIWLWGYGTSDLASRSGKSTEYTQSGNGRFLAYIPSWWKISPAWWGWGCTPIPLHSFFDHVQS